MNSGLNRGHPQLKPQGGMSILRPLARLRGTDNIHRREARVITHPLGPGPQENRRHQLDPADDRGHRRRRSGVEGAQQKFSVPNKEGWETNQAIAAKYNGTGGDTSPLLPVVTLPAGESVDSPQVKSDLTKLDDTLSQDAAGLARGVLRLDRRPGLRLGGRPHHLRDRLPEARPQLELRRQPAGGQGREGRRRGLDRGRGPGPRDRVRRAPAVDGWRGRARVSCSRPCSEDWAR